MNNRTITKIVIKNYQEFTESVGIPTPFEEESFDENVIVAKEVEAIVEMEDGEIFSIGFSVMRNSELFTYESPRRMVQKFLINNFKFDIGD